jgi:hypothetical protein
MVAVTSLTTWPSGGARCKGDGAGWWRGGGACRLGWPAAGSTGVRCASGGTAAVTFLFLHFVFIMWGIEEDFVRIK